MADNPRAARPRPPAARIAIIAALCGASVGLLQISDRRPDPPVPVFQEAVDDPLLMADTEYKFALFAKDFAAWLGIPGGASPTPWEEKAVARYERLALASPPNPLACHRLAVIYATRGYRQQARELLMRALTEDEANADVYIGLQLVYSDDPIPPEQVARTTELLERQPRWWALTTLEELGRRLELVAVAESYRAAALYELWRFGTALGVIAGALVGITLLSLITLLVLGIRALFSRQWGHGSSGIWAFGLPTASWLDILDVVALMVFCNAFGHVLRVTVADGVSPVAPIALALRVLHYLFLAVPALVLVARRAGPRWPLALGLHSKTLGRHALQGLVALGTTLFAVLLVQDVLAASFRVMVPGLGAVTLGGAAWSGNVGTLPLVVQLALVIVVAPMVEEMVFRGYVFRGLLQRLRPAYAAALSGALFAGAHLPSAGGAFVSLMILGIVSAYTYRFTRSLMPSIILHAGYNACVVSTILVLGM